MIEQPGEPLYWNGIKTFKWKGHYWIPRPLWGTVHEQDFLCYVDPEQPEILDNGNLLLPFEYKPFQGRPIGRASVRSIEEWKYGTFEWRFILPKGEYMWPALWLSSDAGWPPEIDCLEGWSGDEPNYVKRLLFKSIKPTMHWSTGADERNGMHRQQTKDNVCRLLMKGDGKENTAKVIWAPNYVDVYYNGWKVKRFKDPEMLKHFNKEGYRMHAIMSTGPYGEPWTKFTQSLAEKDLSQVDFSRSPKVYNDFEIIDFKYSPLR